MFPIPMPFSFLNPRNIIIIALVLIALSGFGIYKCDQHFKGKAQIKHNNQKRDAEVKEAQDRAANYSEVRRLENKIPAKLRMADPVYYDHDCLLGKYESILAECGDNQACQDGRVAHAKAACKKAIERLTPEQIEKRKIEALKKMKSNVTR